MGTIEEDTLFQATTPGQSWGRWYRGAWKRYPRFMRAAPIVLLLAVFGATGCATNLSSMRTAETLEKGQFEAHTAMGVYVPAGQIGKLIAQAGDKASSLKNAEDARIAPTPAEQRQALATALALLVYPPGTDTEFGLRYGLFENLDLGFRYSSSAYHLDARWRFFHIPDGLNLALVAAVEKFRFGGLIVGVYEKIQKAFDLFKWISFAVPEVCAATNGCELEDPSRWDFELQLVASWNWKEILLPYLNLRYRPVTYSIPSVLALGDYFINQQQLKGWSHFIGGTAGIGVGYKYAWLMVELNMAHVIANTKIATDTDGTKEPVDLGGFTVYPAVGIMGRFP